MTEQTAWTPEPGDRYLSVWPHTLGDYEKYPDAVGTVDSGVLYVWRGVRHGDHPLGPDKSRPPLKVYAPGYWATFEHVGDYAAAPAAPPRPPVHQVVEQFVQMRDDRIRTVNYAVQEANAPAMDDHETLVEQTSEIPVYRDPMEKLAPELLDEENGDVNSNSGVGVLVPRAGGGVAPKADEPEEGDGDVSPNTDMSVARFVFGDLWDRPRRWLRERRSQPFRGGRTQLSLPIWVPTWSEILHESRTVLLALLVTLPLLVLVLTTR